MSGTEGQALRSRYPEQAGTNRCRFKVRKRKHSVMTLEAPDEIPEEPMDKTEKLLTKRITVG